MARGKRLRPLRPRLTTIRTQWILGIPTSESAARGLQAEEMALQALQYHQKKRTEFPGQRRITGIQPSLHFSLEDYAGIDIQVQFESPGTSETLNIQVQSRGDKRAGKKFREKRICLVVIKPNNDKEKARQVVFEAISQWFSSN